MVKHWQIRLSIAIAFVITVGLVLLFYYWIGNSNLPLWLKFLILRGGN